MASKGSSAAPKRISWLLGGAGGAVAAVAEGVSVVGGVIGEKPFRLRAVVLVYNLIKGLYFLKDRQERKTSSSRPGKEITRDSQQSRI